MQDPKREANTKTQLIVLEKLALSASKQEKIPEAIKYLRDACRLALQTFGERDPISLHYLNDLTTVLKETEELRNQHKEEIENLSLKIIEG